MSAPYDDDASDGEPTILREIEFRYVGARRKGERIGCAVDAARLARKLIADGPLSGRCGRRFADLAGLSYEDYLGAVERRNLLARNPGRSGPKGDAFPICEARARAWAFARIHAGRRAILLGRRVAAAFGRPNATYLRWGSLAPFSGAMVFPHPSGVSRWWNDGGNVLRARRALSEALLRGEDGHRGSHVEEAAYARREDGSTR